jgi:hypothetical protein
MVRSRSIIEQSTWRSLGYGASDPPQQPSDHHVCVGVYAPYANKNPTQT